MNKTIEFVRRNRAFLVGCLAYTLAVVVMFLVGLSLASKNSDGWTFVPCVLLTLPWFQILAMLPTPNWLFASLTDCYDLPLFALSALLNIAMVAGLRNIFRRS